MSFEEITRRLSLESEAIAIAIVCIALIAILLINRKRLLLRLREWRTQRCLDQIGSEQIRNLSCPDGLDGFYRLDRLALTPEAILLISYRPYSGIIYCAERITEWTQVVGQKSFKFENPLFELENQLTALRLLSGNIPLRGYLFFDQDAIFPKGIPDSVLQPENIPEQYLRRNCVTIKSEIETAWQLLKSQQNGAELDKRASVKT